MCVGMSVLACFVFHVLYFLFEVICGILGLAVSLFLQIGLLVSKGFLMPVVWLKHDSCLVFFIH